MEQTHAVWAAAQFAGAPLGDVRRARRAVTLASAMLAQPGASLPQLAATPYAVQASYHVLAHPAVTPAHLQAPHQAQVRAALQTPGAPVLLVEDTSTFSWAAQTPIPGLGPVGNAARAAGRQGFLLQTVLALRWGTPPDPARPQRPPVTLLGIAAQQYHVRIPAPVAETQGPAATQSRPRQTRWRESALWAQSTAALGAAPTAADGPRWIRICDRGADIYEFLGGCQAAGHSYVVRAAQDRALTPDGTLFAALRAVPALPGGAVSLTLRARPQHPARVAGLTVAALPVTLRAPRRPGHAPGHGASLACTAVRVWEPTPPAGVAPLEWLLLTDQPVGTPADALTVVQQYATRWVIEEFHKVLKTGLGAERLQLERAARLFAAIALMSVVAVRLLHLQEWVRVAPDAPAAEAGLTPLAHRLLVLQAQRPLPTVRDIALAVGRLGGHLNRPRDGLPGWRTLWRGLQRLDAMALGAQLVLDGRFGE